MKGYFVIIPLIVCVCFLFSCEESSTIMDETKSFANVGWPMKDKVVLPFEIEDESQSYDLNVAIRQTNDYPYHNCFFLTKILDSKGSLIKQGLAESFFYDAKSGKSKGQSSGSIISHKYLIFNGLKFPKKQKYFVQIEQYMRKDTLLGIVSVGASITPVSNKNG